MEEETEVEKPVSEEMDLSKLRCAVTVKYTLDFKDLVRKKKNVKYLNYYTDYMLKHYFWYTILNKI